MKPIRTIIIVVLLGIFGYTIYYLYDKSQEKPVVYQTETPEKRDIVVKTVATGSIVPKEEVEIKPNVSGIIDKLYREPGQVVKKGDIIAKIKVIPDMVSLTNAENRLNTARIALENAKLEYERNKKLYQKDAITEVEYQQFELNYKQALQELKAARENVEVIKEGATRSAGSTSNTNVTATISGMILDIPVEVGNSVIESNNFNDGTTIAFIADMDKMIFKGVVDESEVGKLKEGMPLTLTVAAIENETFDATLEYIAPKGVEESGAINFEIKAAVKPKEGSFIRAGYSANANIILQKKENVLAIREALLQFDPKDKPFVEVKTGPDTFKETYVKTGLSDGIYVEIKGGVGPEDEIKIWEK